MKKICLIPVPLLLAGHSMVFAQITTFNFTGTVQTYTVPPCVTQIVVDVRGAQGNCNTSNRCQGGLGGRVQGTVPVTPGEVLQIYVGGGGINSVTGGFNGGGTGGGSGCVTARGAGGGGASDIRRTPYALADRLVVGGGGGGTGGERVQGCGPGAGAGGGGGWYGGGGGGSYSGLPGTGGTQTTGGTGGLGGSGCPGQNAGTNGAFGVGGNGGAAPTNNQFGPNPGCTGGNGGALIGATGVQCTGGGCPGTWAGGSGGGGSSYTAPSVFGVTHTQGFQSSNGQIIITASGGTPITLSGSQLNVTCFGSCNGSATVTASGGTPPFTYLWNPTAQTTATATGLCAGSYTVTVTDAGSCTATQTYTITQPPALTASTTQTNVACNSQCNGSATVTPSGGTPGYTYSWNTAPPQNTQTATGLCAGSYTVTVTDANGCTLTNTVTITQPAVLTATATQTNVACNSQCTGTATVTPSGGTPVYTYSWNTVPPQNTQTATGLCSGSYTVTVTDANGCTVTQTYTITQPPALTATTTQTDLTCNSQCTGTATVTASGGTPGYTYSWNTVPPQNTQAATGLCAGSYTVTVTDANGCTLTQTVSITQPPALTATTTQTNVACNSQCTGTATVTVSGGNPGYSYSWNTVPPQTASSATGLCAGSYTVTVTDANGCTLTQTYTITEPSALAGTTTQTNVACNSQCTGSATVTASGGTPGYTYSWNTVPPQTLPNATGLCAGSYTVIITDANGCTFTTSVTITEPTALSTTQSQVDVPCNNQCSGSATVVVSGGTPGYTYSWTTVPPQTSPTATGLCAAGYTVTVTDANGCTITASYLITQTNAMTSTQTQNNVSCNGGSNGSATITVTGGTPGYTYSWSTTPPQTSSAATGLSAGTYTVIVTDANGCTLTQTVTITEPSAITASTTQIDVLCNGGNTGSATVTASGGTPGYTYSWSTTPPQTTTNATGLTAATYTVTITDANGCSITATVTITQPAALTVTTSGTSTICSGTPTTITGTASGGTAPYSYLWNNGSTTSSQTVNPTTTTTYTIVVTDANGCTSAPQTVTISIYPPLSALASTDTSYCMGGTAQVSVLASGGNNVYTYAWNPNIGNGAGPYTVNPSATTVYTVTVTDGCGQTWSAQITITVNPSPLAAFSCTTLPLAVGQTITFTDSSTGATIWNWNFGDGNSSTLQNPSHSYSQWGQYTVTLIVSNSFGCYDTTTCDIRMEEEIFVPNVFTPNSDGNNDLFVVQNTGMAEYSIIIYDRWGIKMFETTAPNQHWDGKGQNGTDAPDGTYYYVVKARTYTDKEYIFKGFLTLFR